MTPRLRKFALTAHVVSSVGWLGAVAAFLALAVAGLTSRDAQVVRAAYLAMDLIARLVIVPAALASLLTGFVQSLGTPWGLFRHYWVLAKLLITVLADGDAAAPRDVEERHRAAFLQRDASSAEIRRSRGLRLTVVLPRRS